MVDGPVSNRRVSRRVVRQVLLFGGGFILLAALLGGGWFIWNKAAQTAAEQASAAQKAEAEALAQAVSGPLNEIAAGLLALGKRPEIVALFEQRDSAGLAAAAAAHVAEFKSALRLRLLLPGRFTPEPDAQPPLSFASLDMLTNAERSGSPVAAEVHLFGLPGQHLVIVRRAKNKSDQLVGLLHLSLDVALLETLLGGIDTRGGRVELQQSAGGKTVVLAAAGPAAGGPPVLVSVPNTRWNLAWWPAAGSAAGGALSGNWLYLGAGAVLLLLVGGILFWLQRPAVVVAGEDTGRHVKTVIYAGAVKAIMEGAHPGMEQLVPNLPSLGQKRPLKPVSAGMTGDDITMMAHKPAAAPPKAKPGAAHSEAPTDPPQKKSP